MKINRHLFLRDTLTVRFNNPFEHFTVSEAANFLRIMADQIECGETLGEVQDFSRYDQPALQFELTNSFSTVIS
jgi:hypothetical protein